MTRTRRSNNAPAHRSTEGEQRDSLLYRAWERIQYPGGPESRERLMNVRKGRRHGW